MRKTSSFPCIVWAGMALVGSASATADDWELSKAQYQDFAATPDSKLMRDTLALPPGDDLKSAEVARLDLAIMRQPEDVRLLKAWMEYDVAAGVLGLPARPAGSVGEAIERQRASPALLDASQRSALYRAVAAQFPQRSAEGGVVLASKHAYILSNGDMTFGYPADAKDAARAIAHARLTASSCLDRGTCSRLHYFLQQPSTRHAFALAFTVATWLIIAVSLIAFAVSAPAKLVYSAFVAGPPLLIFGMTEFYGNNETYTELAGIVLGIVYGIPICIVCALAAALLRYIARKTRAARTPPTHVRS